MIKIDKGIPIQPVDRKGTTSIRGPVIKYPWAQMEPGDSFLVHGVTLWRLNTATNRRTKSTGERFTIRSTDGGYRVWRIK